MAKNALLKALRNLIERLPDAPQDSSYLFDELAQANDHSCVLLAAEALSEALKRAMLRRFRDNLSRDDRDDLFDFRGPLGTFSSRIQIGYAMSIFGPKTLGDLERVRELRNVFAHSKMGLSFQTKEVADVCELFETHSRDPFGARFFNPSVKTLQPDRWPRYRFEISATMLWSALNSITSRPPELGPEWEKSRPSLVLG